MNEPKINENNNRGKKNLTTKTIENAILIIDNLQILKFKIPISITFWKANKKKGNNRCNVDDSHLLFKLFFCSNSFMVFYLIWKKLVLIELLANKCQSNFPNKDRQKNWIMKQRKKILVERLVAFQLVDCLDVCHECCWKFQSFFFFFFSIIVIEKCFVRLHFQIHPDWIGFNFSIIKICNHQFDFCKKRIISFPYFGKNISTFCCFFGSLIEKIWWHWISIEPNKWNMKMCFLIPSMCFFNNGGPKKKRT